MYTLTPSAIVSVGAGLDLVAGREDVAQLGGGSGAHQAQVHRTCVEAAGNDIDVLKAHISLEIRPGQEGDVDAGRGDDGLEGVVGQVAGVEYAAIVEAEVVPGEGGVGGRQTARRT